MLCGKNPWNLPAKSDKHFKYHILTPGLGYDTFQEKFGFSTPLCRFLRQIFNLDPFSRPNAQQLLINFLSIDKYFIHEENIQKDEIKISMLNGPPKFVTPPTPLSPIIANSFADKPQFLSHITVDKNPDIKVNLLPSNDFQTPPISPNFANTPAFWSPVPSDSVGQKITRNSTFYEESPLLQKSESEDIKEIEETLKKLI
jgi:hypothetical protein